MDQSGESFYDLPATHEYPDPDDYAPNATKYPWEGEDHGYVPPGLPDRPPRSWNGNHPDAWPTSNNGSLYGPVDRPHRLEREATLDPDYQISDAGTT